MKNIKMKTLMWVLLAGYCSVKARLQDILDTPVLRTQAEQFLDNVLQQIPSQDFFARVDECQDGTMQTDADLYNCFVRCADQTRSRVHVIKVLRSLVRQKNITPK